MHGCTDHCFFCILDHRQTSHDSRLVQCDLKHPCRPKSSICHHSKQLDCSLLNKTTSFHERLSQHQRNMLFCSLGSRVKDTSWCTKNMDNITNQTVFDQQLSALNMTAKTKGQQGKPAEGGKATTGGKKGKVIKKPNRKPTLASA